MVLLIAHRGLLDGPDDELENSVPAIELARRLGHDVEIDLWNVCGDWYLGHDHPIYKVSMDWLRTVNSSGYLDQNHLWIHAKNIDALYELRKNRWPGHVFFHDSDAVTMTSTGYIWTHCNTQQLTPLSICVLPEINDNWDRVTELNVHGICTDYVRKLEIMLLKTGTNK